MAKDQFSPMHIWEGKGSGGNETSLLSQHKGRDFPKGETPMSGNEPLTTHSAPKGDDVSLVGPPAHREGFTVSGNQSTRE